MADADRNFYLNEWHVDEEFKWVADHQLRLIQNMVIKFDSKIINEISKHYDADTTEIWEYLNAKARIKAGYCTNADRVRSMTDEELADWLAVYCNGQTAQEVGKPCVSDIGSCEECWLEWLKEEGE